MNSMINFEKGNGLVPVIIQDETTLQVLMLGFMNEEALKLTQITQLKFFEISLWGNPKFRRTIFCVFW